MDAPAVAKSQPLTVTRPAPDAEMVPTDIEPGRSGADDTAAREHSAAAAARGERQRQQNPETNAHEGATEIYEQRMGFHLFFLFFGGADFDFATGEPAVSATGSA